MFSSLALIMKNRSLLVLTMALFMTGFTSAAIRPYFSIVVTHDLGLSDQALSWLTLSTAIANLVIGVSLSVISDHVKERRTLILLANAAGCLGFGLIFLFPVREVFILCSVTLAAMASSSFGLLFGSIRAISDKLDPARSASVNSSARAVFSASWILVPGAVAIALAPFGSMIGAWGFACLASAFSFGMVALLLPRGIAQTGASTGSGLSNFRESVKRLMSRRLLSRIACMAPILGTIHLMILLMPLILVGKAGGQTTDVGFVAGGTAALEIPFMLLWSGLLRRWSVLGVLASGTVIFTIYMGLMSMAHAPWQIYALMLPNACGGAAILSMPMNYLQNLVSDRPGLGTSLYQITTFMAQGIVAAVFGFGSTWLGYSGTALLGGALSIAGIATLWVLDGQFGLADQAKMKSPES